MWEINTSFACINHRIFLVEPENSIIWRVLLFEVFRHYDYLTYEHSLKIDLQLNFWFNSDILLANSKFSESHIIYNEKKSKYSPNYEENLLDCDNFAWMIEDWKNLILQNNIINQFLFLVFKKYAAKTIDYIRLLEGAS